MTLARADDPRRNVLKKDRLLAGAIFFGALMVRLIGIHWGLYNSLHHQSFHPDEPLIFIYSQQINPARLQFLPGFYNYGTLYLTVLRVITDMINVYFGGPSGAGSASFWAWVSRCALGGRIFSACCGAGTAVVVYLMARRWMRPWGALAAAGLIAVAPAFVVHSRFQTVDVPAVFFLAVGLLYAVRIAMPSESESTNTRRLIKDCALAGLFVGLSAGTKYSGVLGYFSVMAALGYAYFSKRFDWKKIAIANLTGIGACLATFLLTTPGAVLDHAKFMRDLDYEEIHTQTGHGLVFIDTASGWVYHLANLSFGIGPIMLAMGLLGLAIGCFRRKAWAIVLIAFALPYYALIARAEVKFLRYTFPLYPVIAIGFGWVVDRSLERKGLGRMAVGLAIAGFGGLDDGGLRGTAVFTSYMVGQDPRDAAVRFLRSRPGHFHVGLASDPWFYTPPVFPDSAMPRSVPLPTRLAMMRATSNPPAVYDVNPDGTPTVFDPDLVTKQRPKYIVFSSFEYDDLARLRGAPDLPPDVQSQVNSCAAFETALRRNYTLDREFGDYVPIHDMEYVQPQVWVWRRRQPG